MSQSRMPEAPGALIASLLMLSAWLFMITGLIAGAVVFAKFGTIEVPLGMHSQLTTTMRNPYGVGAGILVIAGSVLVSMLLMGFSSIVSNVGHMRLTQELRQQGETA